MPLNDSQTKNLRQFVADHGPMGKGPLCVMLVITRHALKFGLPLDPETLVTEGGGQVQGLGKAAVQAILKDHGIVRVLAQEGGRTSRGSVRLKDAYVELLNSLHGQGDVDIAAVESWWIDRINDYLRAQPFRLRMDWGRSVRSIVRDLLAQAEKRQTEASGTMILGTVLQHLVGAKLAVLLGDSVAQHGASVADEVTGRTADFHVQETAIHVTVAPTEALLKKCRGNLEQGLRVIVITARNRADVAEALAEQEGIGDRVDVFDAEQFIASNLHEHGKFEHEGRSASAKQLVGKYNDIIATCETDPSLHIDIS